MNEVNNSFGSTIAIVLCQKAVHLQKMMATVHSVSHRFEIMNNSNLLLLTLEMSALSLHPCTLLTPRSLAAFCLNGR